MKLQEGIDHLREVLTKNEFGCEECRKEHEQLLMWLVELKFYRVNLGISDEDTLDTESNEAMVDYALFEKVFDPMYCNGEEENDDSI